VRTLWRNGSLVGGECIRRGEAYGGEKRKRKERKKGRTSKEKYVRKERGEGRESEHRRNVVLDGVKDVVILLAMLRSEDTLPK
jgi:hypothetical protein